MALSIEGVLTLYDADRCPYCARVRIALAEKHLAYETVEIDLSAFNGAVAIASPTP